MFDLTILTPCLNAGLALARTFESVDRLAASGLKIQHLVLDGVSSDGTYMLSTNQPSWRSFITRPDSGPFDALNRAFPLIHSRFVQVLNAGDVFLPGVEAEIRSALRQPNTADILTFDAKIGHHARAHAIRDESALRFGSAGRHEAVFIRRTLIQRTSFDPRYRICADRDQLLTLLPRGARLRSSSTALVSVEAEGLSTRLFWRKEVEHCLISFRHFGFGRVLLGTIGLSVTRLAAKLVAQALYLDWVATKNWVRTAARSLRHERLGTSGR